MALPAPRALRTTAAVITVVMDFKMILTAAAIGGALQRAVPAPTLTTKPGAAAAIGRAIAAAGEAPPVAGTSVQITGAVNTMATAEQTAEDSMAAARITGVQRTIVEIARAARVRMLKATLFKPMVRNIVTQRKNTLQSMPAAKLTAIKAAGRIWLPAVMQTVARVMRPGGPDGLLRLTEPTSATALISATKPKNSSD